MWVVQLDGCGVGFCDARPCKGGCRQALQIFQIKQAATWGGGPLGQVTFTSKRPGELTCELLGCFLAASRGCICHHISVFSDGEMASIWWGRPIHCRGQGLQNNPKKV